MEEYRKFEEQLQARLEKAKISAETDVGDAFCTDRLMETAEELKGTPMQDKVLSLVDQLEEIDGFMRAMKQKYERGERE